MRPLRYKSGWRVNTIRNGKPVRARFSDRRWPDAFQAATEFIRNLDVGTSVSGTSLLPDLVDQYIRISERTGRKSGITAMNDRRRLLLFLKFCGKQRLRFVPEIGTNTLRKYKDYWFDGFPHYTYKTTRTRWKPDATWEHHRITLQGFFAFCLDRHLITENPVKADRSLKGKVKQTAARWYSEEEVGLLLGWIDTRHDIYESVWFRLLLHTGLRRNEALQLRWRNVRLSNATLTLEHTKSDKPQSVPISPVLLDWLKELPKGKPDSLVFSRKDGQPYHSGNYWYRLIRCGLAELGLPQGGLHALRHTLGVYLASKGENQRFIQEMFRHSTGRMTERYTQIASEQLRPMVSRIDLGAKPKR
jgi:integrase